MKLTREIEKKYCWRAITMIHGQERMGSLGFPVYRYVDVEAPGPLPGP